MGTVAIPQPLLVKGERVIVSVILLRKVLSFSNGCSQFVQNMNAVCILNLIVDFRLLHSHITLKI